MNRPKAYRSGLVQRYHANPDLARIGQTNSQHQWGVALLVILLHPNPNTALLVAANTHDIGEVDACDLSGPFKRQFPALARDHREIEDKFRGAILQHTEPKLSELDKTWLGFADRLEACLFVLLHRPDVARVRGWPEMISSVVAQSVDLGCRLGTLQLIENVRNGDRLE